MEREDEQIKEQADFSGGIQQKTTEFLAQDSDLDDAQNARYGKSIGGVAPSEGYTQTGSDLTSSTTTSTSTSTTTTSTSTSTSTTSTSTSTSTTTSTSTSTTTTA